MILSIFLIFLSLCHHYSQTLNFGRGSSGQEKGSGRFEGNQKFLSVGNDSQIMKTFFFKLR